MMEFKLHNRNGGLCCKSCGRQDKQLNTYDWLADIPGNADESELVEFSSRTPARDISTTTTRYPGERRHRSRRSHPGHDIGVVTLTGRLVPLQMKKANIKSGGRHQTHLPKAKPVDMEKYNGQSPRTPTMIRSRQIALDLNLNMKIGDVEYQGDGNKAIFYYIADRTGGLPPAHQKVLADAFRVRIEMKQIGARQEAGRIGGIGPCGRELCCATWMTSFVSVSHQRGALPDIH